MKILVMSDSHGNANAMLTAVAAHSPELILHLGDHDRDCAVLSQDFPQIPLRRVKGNCDRASLELENDEFVLSGIRFFMTHGHNYAVKTGLSAVINAALLRNADTLLFGHTHIQHYSVVQSLAVINPGSIGSKDYAVLSIENGNVVCELKHL